MMPARKPPRRLVSVDRARTQKNAWDGLAGVLAVRFIGAVQLSQNIDAIFADKDIQTLLKEVKAKRKG